MDVYGYACTVCGDWNKKVLLTIYLRKRNTKLNLGQLSSELTTIMGIVDAVWLTKQLSGSDGSHNLPISNQ